MSGFFLANPLGLWALSAVGGVVALYLFYRRYRPIRATGLFLWGIPRRGGLGGRKVEVPQINRTFAFDLLAVFFFALALAAPGYRSLSGMRVVAILDGSFAMHAKDGHIEARRAVREIIVRTKRAGHPAAVILAGKTPSVMVGMEVSASDAENILAEYDPRDEVGNLSAAIGLAREIYGQHLDVHILTNQNYTPPPGGDSPGTIHTFPGKGGNLAFVDVWRTVEGGADTLSIAAMNYSDKPAIARLRARTIDGDKDLYTEILKMPSGERAYVEIILTGIENTTLEVTLSAIDGDDVIAEDSIVFVPPAGRKDVSFALDGLTGGNARYFRLGLEAAGCVAWSRAGDNDAPDILVTTDPNKDGKALTLIINAQGRAGIFDPPYVVDLADPLCRDVNLGLIPWTVADLDAKPDPSPQKTMITAGNLPLYWQASPGRLHLNLIPEKCSIVTSSVWPALLANAVALARERQPGLGKRSYRPSERIHFVANAKQVDGRVPLLELLNDGRVVQSQSSDRPFPMPRRSGSYSLANNGESLGEVSVVPLYGMASNALILAVAADVTKNEAGDDRTAEGIIDLTWLALVAAIVFLACNWRSGVVR